MQLFSTLLAMSFAFVIIKADYPHSIPSGIQELFDEIKLPCTPHYEVNHNCYFCKCNIHGDRQLCIYVCNPTYGQPVTAGSKMCAAQDKFKQGCKICHCSKGQLFYDCFISTYCSDSEIVSEKR